MNENAHHWGWMIIVLIIFFGAYWIYSTNRPDSYTRGAIHAEQHRQDWPLSVHIGEGGCAHLDSLKPLTNSVKK